MQRDGRGPITTFKTARWKAESKGGRFDASCGDYAPIITKGAQKSGWP